MQNRISDVARVMEEIINIRGVATRTWNDFGESNSICLGEKIFYEKKCDAWVSLKMNTYPPGPFTGVDTGDEYPAISSKLIYSR